MRGKRHRCEDREHVDDERVGVLHERQRRCEACERADEVHDDEDPLPPVSIADDRDDRCDEGAGNHSREQDEADRGRAVGIERDDAQGDDRRPFGGVEASPRELCTAEIAIAP